MDAVLSLPLVSYLLIPGVTTYSTSLNLLFFYITWSTLVLSHAPLKVEMIGSVAVRVLFFIVPSLVFLLFDSALPTVAVSIKTQGATALPTRTISSGSRRKSSRQQNVWWLITCVGLGNLLLGVALQAGVELLFTHVLHIRSALKVTTTLPSPWHMIKDLLRGFLVREATQYYVHRFLLHSSNSGLKQFHQTWQHSVTAPHSFVAHFDHPLAWFLWRWIPTYGPAILFRFHLLTYFLFLALISLEESFTFSGYSSFPSIILGGITRRQDHHLRTGGRGNFAPWGVFDWLHGTSVGGDIGEDVRDELDEHDVAGKANSAWEGAKATGREKIGGRKKGKS